MADTPSTDPLWLVQIVDEALRAAGFVGSVNLERIAAAVASAATSVSADEPLDLSRIVSALSAEGLDETHAFDLALYVHERAQAIQLETLLPAALKLVSAEDRESRLMNFSANLLAPPAGVSPAHHNPRWLDETPAVSLLSIHVTDPTARTPTFLVMSGTSLGAVFRLTRAKTTIGREPWCDVVLDEHGVSRKHAVVERRQDQLTIRDLGSRNGVLVNGLGVTEHELQDGDRVYIGANAILRFNWQDELDESFTDRLNESLTVDTTTGAYNRRFFQHRLRVECAFAQRHTADLALLFLDLDHFKRINDSHGHPAGDAILRGVVELLKEQVRLEDIVGRWGGEELVVLLRGTSGERARDVGERIRERIASARIKHEETELQVTCSVGVASLVHGKLEAPEALLEAADRAMYLAKDGGRNRVHVFVPAESSPATGSE